jgi:hypothetical protein
MAQLAGLKVAVSEETLRRVRDYAVNEPGFTVSFAAWDLSQTGKPITPEAVRLCMPALLKQGVIEVVEDAGRAGKVYAYVPPPLSDATRDRRLFAELDDARIGELAPARGIVVPHTGEEGPSGKPGRDRKRQSKGVRIKRGRQGT